MTQLHKMRLELRRGVLVLAVLAALREEHYGYSLRKTLVAKGIDIDEGTLYPMIRRLESHGLLISEWRMESARKKRFYRLSQEGLNILDELENEWQTISHSLNDLLEKKP